MAQLTPRVPTTTEKVELIEAVLRRWYRDPDAGVREEVAWLVNAAAIAVFDDYCTGGPGYAGKVLVVVWDGGPSQTEVYIWHDGTLQWCWIDR